MTKPTSTTCSRCWRRAGLTLVEVVAAIAILGTLLVGVVLAKARHTRQAALAVRTRSAVREADALIAGWWARPEGVPVGEAGTLEEAEPPFAWQTREVANPEVEALGARVVRVALRPAGAAEGGGAVAPLVVVDLVLPPPEADAGAADDEASAAAEGGRP